jgi:tartrate-resistant acid phosphatase type 5
MSSLLLLTLTLLLLPTNSNNAFKFLAMGDWGDDTITKSSPYYIAKFMNEEAKGAGAILAIGDNFYEIGVKDVNDTQFKTKFQDVFIGDNVKKIPFLVVNGNHDNYGNPGAQVDYTYVDPTKRWKFPSFYYTKTFEQDNVKVMFVMVDTWRLNGGDFLLGVDCTTSKIWIKSEHALQYALHKKMISHETGLFLRQKFPIFDEDKKSQPDTRQWTWLKQTLLSAEANSSDWVIVVGHFAVHSASRFEHGDTPSLVENLEPLLKAAHVPVYLNGHDHILQHIKKQDGPTHYYGTGAGAKKHPSVFENYPGLLAYQAGMYGFTKHEISKTEMKTTFFASINGTKKITYQYVQQKQVNSNSNNMGQPFLLRGSSNAVVDNNASENVDQLVVVE